MERSNRQKKIQNKKQVAKGERKRGKKQSRREKKPVKNVEKKTRSGCIYSPYEIYFEKSMQNQHKISDRHAQTHKPKLAPATTTRRLNLSGPNREIGDNSHNETEVNIVSNTENLLLNKMIPKEKISSQKMLVNCETKIFEDGKENNTKQDPNHKLNILPAKNARKRGRKPRVITAETDITHENVDSISSDRQKNEKKILQPIKMIKHCEEVELEEEDKLPCVSLNVREENGTSQFPENLQVQKEFIKDTSQKKLNESERKDSVDINDEKSDDLMSLNLIRHSNLLDLVFPDPELNDTISEEELGSCIDHGCNINAQEFEENVVNSFRLVCTSNCMFTDTDKYIFKSCFKNIESQIQNFDQYRGAETPGGEASLYDVSESSPIDTRKLYRKNFSDLKLNIWYNYVYHSAQLARIGGNAFSPEASSSNSVNLDLQLDDIFHTLTRGGSSSYLPGENIWRCNFLMGIPSVDEVLSDPSPSDFQYSNF